ncbi:MAG: hypothetical protein HND40_03580 [Ignavibacteriota bacterium]|nr:hypothetical protein [Ignavibacteriota bacterium]MCO6446541.1 hypothetical protein [Ignavibacterium album]QKJ98709.1 MAG: hypothetical protein HND40_03580 [Ignavibacteriota bacterium]HOJ08340.1 hypothetical protein [Ignavibacteriaceae bacterium]
MDDLFQLLIWGIIIFSFLSSFFKKKEPPKKTTPNRNHKTDANISSRRISSSVPEAITQKRDEYDILREIENLFKGEVNIPPPQPRPVQKSYEHSETEIKDKNLDHSDDIRLHKSVEDKRPIGSRETYDTRILNRKTAVGQPRVVSPKAEADAENFERHLSGKVNQRSNINDLNRKLKNPVTIKEYILFSEILGKPKALRR